MNPVSVLPTFFVALLHRVLRLIVVISFWEAPRCCTTRESNHKPIRLSAPLFYPLLHSSIHCSTTARLDGRLCFQPTSACFPVIGGFCAQTEGSKGNLEMVTTPFRRLADMEHIIGISARRPIPWSKSHLKVQWPSGTLSLSVRH